MYAKDPSVHVAEALLRASELSWQPRPGEAAGRGPTLSPATPLTIALSREAGAGGTSVARAVGGRLNWPVYDHELLAQIAKDLRVGVNLVESVDERPGNWLQDWVGSLAGAPTIAEPAYFRRLLQMLLSLGSRGECVIVGRGAAQLLPAATTLRVRLIASRDDRVAAVSRELGLSRPEAVHYVDTKDRERTRFIQDHFGKDPADPQHYDLVLNSSCFSVVECAELIIEALRRRQARPPETKT